MPLQPENKMDHDCPGCNAVPGEKHTYLTVGRNLQCPGDDLVDVSGHPIPEKRRSK